MGLEWRFNHSRPFVFLPAPDGKRSRRHANPAVFGNLAIADT
jgi:hypothetical protein